MKQLWSELGGKLGVGLCGAGLLLVFLGWNGAASADRVEAQFPYLISGGLAGLSLVLIGVGLLVVQNQRADRARLEQALREVREAMRPPDPDAGFRPPAPRATPEAYVVEQPQEQPAPAPAPQQDAAKASTTATPTEKRTAKKTAAKKTAAKKRTAKKAPARKATRKKAAAKRAGAGSESAPARD